jgi:hypothetical protein
VLTRAQARAEAKARARETAAARAQQRIAKQAARSQKMAAALLLDEGPAAASDEGGDWRDGCVRPGEALAGLLACLPDVLSAEAGPLVRVQQAAAGGMQVFLAGGQGLEIIPPPELEPGLLDDTEQGWGKRWWVGQGEREYELLAHWGTVGQAVRVRSRASWRLLQLQVRECSIAAMAVEEQAHKLRLRAAAAADDDDDDDDAAAQAGVSSGG